MIPLSWCLVLGAVLFAIGFMGVVLRRNGLSMLLAVEIMVNAANLNLVAFATTWGLVEGQTLVLFIIGVEAAELAAALAVVTAWRRLTGENELDAAHSLGEEHE